MTITTAIPWLAKLNPTCNDVNATLERRQMTEGQQEIQQL
jgi:hypothetical protein